jgi:cyclic pyranopterin monophosphate synthase
VETNLMPEPPKRLTHVDAAGDPGMVDVHAKAVTHRHAVAEALLVFPPEALAGLRGNDWQSAKGPVWHTAVIAGTQAVKRTADLIPFCHALPVEGCRFTREDTVDGLRLCCTVVTTHKTGVEMEALTGVAMAALTVIDMCKALSPRICVTQIRLLEKSGGKHGVHTP